MILEYGLSSNDSTTKTKTGFPATNLKVATREGDLIGVVEVTQH